MATVTLSIDGFDSVSSTLYVEVRLDGSNLNGSWTKTKDTLGGQPPFPDGGAYETPMGGATLKDNNGNVVCCLQGVVPGQNFGSSGDVASFVLLTQYSIAEWHFPSTAP
jgi:hypothetical protein